MGPNERIWKKKKGERRRKGISTGKKKKTFTDEWKKEDKQGRQQSRFIYFKWTKYSTCDALCLAQMKTTELGRILKTIIQCLFLASPHCPLCSYHRKADGEMTRCDHKPQYIIELSPQKLDNSVIKNIAVKHYLKLNIANQITGSLAV